MVRTPEFVGACAHELAFWKQRSKTALARSSFEKRDFLWGPARKREVTGRPKRCRTNGVRRFDRSIYVCYRKETATRPDDGFQGYPSPPKGYPFITQPSSLSLTGGISVCIRLQARYMPKPFENRPENREPRDEHSKPVSWARKRRSVDAKIGKPGQGRTWGHALKWVKFPIFCRHERGLLPIRRTFGCNSSGRQTSKASHGVRFARGSLNRLLMRTAL